MLVMREAILALGRKLSPVLRSSQLASSIAGRSRGRWQRAGQRMINERVTHLRHQAEHCRRLALGVDDDKAITAILGMALEYDQKADRFERMLRRVG